MLSPKTPNVRGAIRKNTESSQRSSSKRIEISSLPSGIRLILSEMAVTQPNNQQIRDSLVRYLKFEESYSRLRPVDIEVMFEYAQTQVSFVKEFSEKRELVINMLLHMFFYRNAKYIKNTYAEKNPKDDIREFHRLLVAHKAALNSLEVRTLLKWLDDYLDHWQLFYFKAEADDSLDIIHNVMIDIPTYVPPLCESNFIPQSKNNQVEVDSEEEEQYARRSFGKVLAQKEEPTEEVQEQTEEKKPQKNEIEEYIHEKVFGASQQVFQKIEHQDRVVLEAIEAKKAKK